MAIGVANLGLAGFSAATQLAANFSNAARARKYYDDLERQIDEDAKQAAAEYMRNSNKSQQSNFASQVADSTYKETAEDAIDEAKGRQSVVGSGDEYVASVAGGFAKSNAALQRANADKMISDAQTAESIYRQDRKSIANQRRQLKQMQIENNQAARQGVVDAIAGAAESLAGVDFTKDKSEPNTTPNKRAAFNEDGEASNNNKTQRRLDRTDRRQDRLSKRYFGRTPEYTYTSYDDDDYDS